MSFVGFFGCVWLGSLISWPHATRCYPHNARGLRFRDQGANFRVRCATPEQRTLFAFLEMSHQRALTDMLSGSMKRCRVRAAAARSTNWTQSSTVDTKTKTVRVKQLQVVGSFLPQDADTISAMRWISVRIVSGHGLPHVQRNITEAKTGQILTGCARELETHARDMELNHGTGGHGERL